MAEPNRKSVSQHTADTLNISLNQPKWKNLDSPQILVGPTNWDIQSKPAIFLMIQIGWIMARYFFLNPRNNCSVKNLSDS
jgi:hypothetical protein